MAVRLSVTAGCFLQTDKTVVVCYLGCYLTLRLFSDTETVV